MYKIKLLLLLSLFLSISATNSAQFKKWVDENGTVHYGANIPPQYVDKAHSKLNSNGIQVEHEGRAKSGAEIAKEKELKALRKQQKKLLANQKAKDRALLNLFRTEDDIIMVRNGKISQLDTQIRHKKRQITRSKQRLSKAHTDAANTERKGQKINAEQQQYIDNLQHKIETSYAYIFEKEALQKEITAAYDINLKDFRRLRNTNGKKALNETTSTSTSEAKSLLDTVILCGQKLNCDKTWSLAKSYAKQHATTSTQSLGERILVTAPATAKTDISITVSRIGEGKAERIFLDLQCASSLSGEKLCGTPAVKDIQINFQKVILKGASNN